MPRSKKLPVYFTPDEAKALVAAAPSRRDRLIMLLGLLEGMRVSEICKLKVEHVDFSKGQLLVYQGKGGRDRVLPIHKKVKDPLRQWIGDKRQGWVFPSARRQNKPITTRTVQYMIQKAGIEARILHRCRPHGLRHAFASMLVRNGADIVYVRDLLGHSSVATTSIYLHADAEHLRHVVDLL